VSQQKNRSFEMRVFALAQSSGVACRPGIGPAAAALIIPLFTRSLPTGRRENNADKSRVKS
jgi:hypothetical protein